MNWRKVTKEEQGTKKNIRERRDGDKERGEGKREKVGKDESTENTFCLLTEQGVCSHRLILGAVTQNRFQALQLD